MLETTAPSIDVLQKPYRIERADPAEAAALCRVLESGEPEINRTLSDEEALIVSAFKAPKRRRDWLAGRLAAKRLMSWVLAQDGTYLKFSEIEVLNRPSGEPYVRLPGGLTYDKQVLSLSHSKAGGVAAISQPGCLVGVDLEAVELRDRAFLELMAHDEEWDSTMDSDLFEQTRLWTLKEAVVKLLGIGFTAAFHDVRFPLFEGDARRLSLHGRARESWIALGRPIIHFDSTFEDEDVLSVAYTTGDSPNA